jgi:hypothetical protein
LYDSGDQPDGPAEGYGSMQIHAQHPGGNQTLLAVNHWREGQRADLGIGNQAGQNPDWTFAANAGAYPTKRLRVLVRLGADVDPAVRIDRRVSGGHPVLTGSAIDRTRPPARPG